jgi:putative transposase
MKRYHPATFKAHVVHEILKEDTTIAQIAAAQEVHPTQLRRWKAVVVDGLPSRCEEKDSMVAMRADAEERRNGRSGERGRGPTQVTRSREEHLGVSAREREERSGRIQVELVSRSEVSSQPHPPSPADVQLTHRNDDSDTPWPCDGSRKSPAPFPVEGRDVTGKAIQRPMRERGIAGICPGPNLSTRTHTEGIVDARRPVCLPILSGTDSRVRGGWMYPVAVLDWDARSVLRRELDQT